MQSLQGHSTQFALRRTVEHVYSLTRAQSCKVMKRGKSQDIHWSVTNATQQAETGPALSELVHGSLTETAWEQLMKAGRFPKLGNDLKTDILIVGAGVAGLTAALRLLQAGKSVAVLEARLVGSGNSGRYIGDLTAWKRHQYSVLLSQYDKATVTSIAESHTAAIKAVKKIVEDEKIDCSIQQIDGYVFAYEGQDAETKIQKELSASKEAGLKNVSLVDNLDIGEGCGSFPHAIKVQDTIVLDPIRYLDGLADAVIRAGGQIYEQTRVKRPNSETCITQDGHEVKAGEAVVVATGTPITHDLIDSSIRAIAVHGKQLPRRRYAVAFELPQDAALEGMFYELAEHPYVVRVSKTSDGGLHLIVTGEEHDQGIPAEEFHDFFGRLETWTRAKWPAVQSRTHQWSSQVFETSELLSYHGKDPAPSPDTDFYISHGDGGETLTAATLGGLIISDEILGRENPFSKLYSPSRKLLGPPALPPINLDYVKNTVTAVAKQILPQLSSPDLDSLAPDSGVIVQKDVSKLAVYKDTDGEVHVRSAVCPHLGCLLQWNPVEKQWNCPCHGSCFDKKGVNLGGGPSTLDMGMMADALD